jgi:hypothetical protein
MRHEGAYCSGAACLEHPPPDDSVRPEADGGQNWLISTKLTFTKDVPEVMPVWNVAVERPTHAPTPTGRLPKFRRGGTVYSRERP